MFPKSQRRIERCVPSDECCFLLISHQNQKQDVGELRSADEATECLTLDQAEPNLGAIELPDWQHLALHPMLLRALVHLKYSTPTEIQKRIIPPALTKHDVLGAAETVCISNRACIDA